MDARHHRQSWAFTDTLQYIVDDRNVDMLIKSIDLH